VAFLKVIDLHKSYGRVPVLKGVNLEVKKKQVLTLLGRSGSGKSTLLRCIHLLEEFERGQIVLDGELLGYKVEASKRRKLSGAEIARQRAQIGMVFQHFALFPHMTVLENVTVGPIQVRKVPRKQAVEEAEKILDDVGLLDKKDEYPPSLSGGQQQRVGIARALAMCPKLMLFDEPTSALDPELVQGVLDLMIKIAESGMTMIVVTHELDFARRVSSEAAFFHEGQVWEKGPTEKVLRSPERPETRQFLRSIL